MHSAAYLLKLYENQKHMKNFRTSRLSDVACLVSISITISFYQNINNDVASSLEAMGILGATTLQKQIVLSGVFLHKKPSQVDLESWEVTW